MLFTPHLFVFRKDGTRQSLSASSLGRQHLCLVPREKCSFRRIKIAGKHKKALQAAEFRVRQQSDSNENQFIIVPDASGARAGVWGFETREQHKGRYIPESLALTSFDSGVRLITLMQGFEGQIWDEGRLVGSRWWAQKPDPKKWAAFLHSVQGESEIDFQSMPEAQTLPYRTDFPRFKINKARLADIFAPVKLGGIIALGLGCWFLFISGQYFKYQLAMKRTTNDIESLSSFTAQISSERRRAIANRRQAEKYNVIGHSGAFLLGLGDLTSVLDGKGLLIERMTMNSNELEIRLRSSDNIDIPVLVTQLEAKRSLSNVNIGIGVGGVVVLTADLIAPFDYSVVPASTVSGT